MEEKRIGFFEMAKGRKSVPWSKVHRRFEVLYRSSRFLVANHWPKKFWVITVSGRKPWGDALEGVRYWFLYTTGMSGWIVVLLVLCTGPNRCVHIGGPCIESGTFSSVGWGSSDWLDRLSVLSIGRLLRAYWDWKEANRCQICSVSSIGELD